MPRPIKIGFITGLILTVAMSAWEFSVKDIVMPKYTNYRLASDTASCVGELARHWSYYKNDSNYLVSYVRFKVGNEIYSSMTNRIMVPVGIKFKVLYNRSNPEYNRVIVPDSLLKFQNPRGWDTEDQFYTWPPISSDSIQKIILNLLN